MVFNQYCKDFIEDKVRLVTMPGRLRNLVVMINTILHVNVVLMNVKNGDDLYV